MLSRSTWTKIAVGTLAVILLYCLISSSRCNCNKKARKLPIVTAVPMMVRPEKFADYEPDEDPEEEYADYMPDQEEEDMQEDYTDPNPDWVDAGNMYSSPEYKSELLDD